MFIAFMIILLYLMVLILIKTDYTKLTDFEVREVLKKAKLI